MKKKKIKAFEDYINDLYEIVKKMDDDNKVTDTENPEEIVQDL